MPRYYFDLLDGEDLVKDEEGMDLPNISSAQTEATEFLTDMVEDIATRQSNPLGYPCPSRFATLKGRYLS
jgi:hypothetical protein